MSQRPSTPASQAPDWRRLEREKRDLLRPPPDASVEELLRQGVHLSAQAVRLVNAVEPPGDGRAAPTS